MGLKRASVLRCAKKTPLPFVKNVSTPLVTSELLMTAVLSLYLDALLTLEVLIIEKKIMDWDK